ncbi:MAG: ATP-binding protein [Methanobrevibacter sp.]|nr:ATP-binding protein [Methanobrevibacter sp.]
MECYVTYCVKGFYAFNENNELIAEKLFKEDEILEKLIEIDNKEIPTEESELINELSKSYETIFIESNKRSSDYKSDKVKVKNPNPGGDYLRSNFDFDFDNEIYQKLAIYKMKKAQAGEDKHLIQAINSIDEIDESISKLIERIREWYALYFPEMDLIKNNETYIKLIYENKTKEEIVNAKSDAFPEDMLDIEDDINPVDLEIMNKYAKSIYELQQTRKDIINYIDVKMESVAPNLRLLVGSSLGAKLISHAGGLKRLASYPSSTVQIMGAEKALFRHLKSGDRPPKYGLIYQHPQVRGAKWWNRGKIARLLAGRISLAARKDVFTHDFNPEIFNEFNSKVEEIEKNNPFPTKTTKKRKEEKQQSKKKHKKGKKRRRK